MPAPTIDELAIGDEPAAWSALGFAVEGDSCVIGDVCLRLGGSAAGKGLHAWSLRDLLTTELDGLPTAGSEREPSVAGPAHANGIAAIDHVVVITPHLERTIDALEAAGMDLRRIRDEPTPTGAPRQAFFRLGALILEVVQEPDEVVERDGRDRPSFFWGIALVAPDLEATVAELGDRVSEIRDAVQPDRKIATLRRSAGLSLPVALMSAST